MNNRFNDPLEHAFIQEYDLDTYDLRMELIHETGFPPEQATSFIQDLMDKLWEKEKSYNPWGL